MENERGELLLSLRPEGKAFADHWEFPGGKIEVGETPFSALQRELQEELHLDVSLVEDFGVYRFLATHVELHFFRVRSGDVPKRTSASKKIGWFKPQDALALHLVPADEKPLKDYLRRVEFNSVTSE